MPKNGSPPPDQEKPPLTFLTEFEVAKLVRLSRRTLERRRLDGSGPVFTKLGRRVVYRRDDVERWADQNRFSSTSEVEVRRG
jgi:predicted DNA-binding transcriptional regulator AlpA